MYCLSYFCSSLDLKVVLLVRDPRGTVQSRKHRDFCPKSPDCHSARLLCSDLVENFHAAKELSQLFPGQVLALRYEDFSAGPATNAPELYHFLGIKMHIEVEHFIQSHTQTQTAQTDMFSTVRNSATVPYHWRKDLTFPEIQAVQSECSDAMQLWGYQEYQNQADVDMVWPVNKFTFGD